MLISRSKNFAFIHIPKNAGISFRAALGSYGKCPLATHTHAGIRDVSLPHSMYKFAVIRDPYARMVSVYEFSKRRYLEDKARYKNFKGYSELEWDFEKWLTEGQMWEDNFRVDDIPPVQRRSQSYYVTNNDKDIAVDFLLELEHLDRDIPLLENALDIQIDLEHKNATNVSDYKSYYTPKAIEHIEKYFAWEIKEFGYTL